jgi:hypothetical protein
MRARHARLAVVAMLALAFVAAPMQHAQALSRVLVCIDLTGGEPSVSVNPEDECDGGGGVRVGGCVIVIIIRGGPFLPTPRSESPTICLDVPEHTDKIRV